MRPIIRGAAPTDAKGAKIIFNHYSEARGHLKLSIGPYCSYCERRLEYGVQIEHIHPKSRRPDLELEWTNFLIACPNCNPIKNDKPIIIEDYVWPDLHNTYLFFTYFEGFVFASKTSDIKKAQAMIDLIGLDRITINDPLIDGTQTDERQLYRFETWELAKRYYNQLLENDTEEKRGNIIDLAIARGYWSVWMTIFKDDDDMLDRLINAFSGTNYHYFNKHQNV
ncbi:uncharacterized protein (TIGR02646 family) [Paenibacillus sp. PastF-3]|uniref:HNH endonuclease n=1 Tax=Paenibacillus sp. PastF-3 TaxID=2940626 RepID=UPI002475B8F8|nr:HNH endonuclease [Paenibacillus sp. PastF-3]MDH6374931.1 uncharacterized protein (TIGR02646 family) [Paenibacillus sp. PastF-3]